MVHDNDVCVTGTWSTEGIDHTPNGCKLKAISTIRFYQEIVAERNYLIAQLLFLTGTTGPTEDMLQREETKLGPFFDSVSVSIRPTIEGDDVQPVVAFSNEYSTNLTASSSQITQSFVTGAETNLGFPITFHGAGITPGISRHNEQSVNVTMNSTFEFKRVITNDVQCVKLQLNLCRLSNFDGIYNPGTDLYKKMPTLSEDYGAGLGLIPIFNSLPTIRWEVPRFLRQYQVDFSICGRISGIYKRNNIRLTRKFKAYHHDLHPSYHSSNVVPAQVTAD